MLTEALYVFLQVSLFLSWVYTEGKNFRIKSRIENNQHLVEPNLGIPLSCDIAFFHSISPPPLPGKMHPVEPAVLLSLVPIRLQEDLRVATFYTYMCIYLRWLGLCVPWKRCPGNTFLRPTTWEAWRIGWLCDLHRSHLCILTMWQGYRKHNHQMAKQWPKHKPSLHPGV